MLITTFLSVALGIFVTSSVARPLVPAERRYLPWRPDLPACDDAGVLGEIQWRFRNRESEFWQTGLEIAHFDSVAERGYRSAGEDYIPRRFCQAKAMLNDQGVRSVAYTIDQDLGFLGLSYGVHWCVVGLDRHDANEIACRMLQP
jgi:hypothetical protein